MEPTTKPKLPKFIFPKKLAQKMKDVPMHIQMESSMVATTCLLAGLVFIAVYQMFFLEISRVLKGAIIFNIVCAMILMGGYIVTSYQQYANFILTLGIDLKQFKREAKAKRKQDKLNAKAFKMASQLQKAGYKIESREPIQSPQENSFLKTNPKISNPADTQLQNPLPPKVSIKEKIKLNRAIKQQKKLKQQEETEELKKLFKDERRLIEEL